MVKQVDDFQVLITLIIFFVSNIISVYKVMDKLSDRIAMIEGKIEQLEKTLNVILNKMLNSGNHD